MIITFEQLNLNNNKITNVAKTIFPIIIPAFINEFNNPLKSNPSVGRVSSLSEEPLPTILKSVDVIL